MTTQLVMPFAVEVSYHPADFIEGEANREALSLMRRWPDWPYSIVLLIGAKGAGKTHIARLFAAHAKATLLDPKRLGRHTADQLLTGNHAWVLDSLNEVADEAALAQLINHARARGDYLLLTTHSAPAHRAFKLPDLRSRLLALPSVTLQAPDDALLAAILLKAFADRQLTVTPEIIRYAVRHLERSVEAMHTFAAKVDQISLASHREVSLALVRDICHDSASTHTSA
jgi:chromosomal replication initiation ATPase DnaA